MFEFFKLRSVKLNYFFVSAVEIQKKALKYFASKSFICKWLNYGQATHILSCNLLQSNSQSKKENQAKNFIWSDSETVTSREYLSGTSCIPDNSKWSEKNVITDSTFVHTSYL